MAKQRYTAEKVITALRASGGVMAEAAKKLECHRGTVENYIKRYPTVAAAYEEARATLVDTAESKLMAMVDHGEWPAVRFVLVTLGNRRGYGPHAEVATAAIDPREHDYELALDMVYGEAEVESQEAAESEEPGV
jgi:hypothetical protein